MNGFRQNPQTSKKEKLKSMESELKNAQMAVRLNQMLSQKMIENQKEIQRDMNNALKVINELQYKLLAIQKVAQLDVVALTAEVDSLRLKDFNDASDKEDVEANLLVAEQVEEDSTVILTTVTENMENSIFRSRIKLAEAGVPELVSGLLGKKVGTKVDVQLNGVTHTVELLGIRTPVKQSETV
jgi:hypothetical protein